MPGCRVHRFITASFPDLHIQRLRLPGDPTFVLGRLGGKLSLVLHPDLTHDEEVGALRSVIRHLASLPAEIGDRLAS